MEDDSESEDHSINSDNGNKSFSQNKKSITADDNDSDQMSHC